jgi:hypothetical protein
MYYSLAMGKIASSRLKEWKTELIKNKGYSINYIYLNMDMHETWGIKSKDDNRIIKFDF